MSVARCAYQVAPEIFHRFPNAQIGVAIARLPVLKKSAQPKEVQKYLSAQKQAVTQSLMQKGITADNYLQSPVCQSWRNVFGTFGVDANKCCTIQHLYRRAATEADKMRDAVAANKKFNADLGHVSNVVDLSNIVALRTDTPMGVIDLSKIEGNLTLRFGKGEGFTPIGENVHYEMRPSHVVLADVKKVITWLWTYKIGEDACVRESEAEMDVLVCSDQAEDGIGNAKGAIDAFLEGLPSIGGKGKFLGVATKDNPEVVIEKTDDADEKQ